MIAKTDNVKDVSKTSETIRMSPYWSECGLIFFDHGKGWGLNDDLSTVCLGDEEAVKAYLGGEKVQRGLNPTGRAALDWIAEYRKGEGFGNDGLNTRSVERTSTRRTAGREYQAARIFKARKGLARRNAYKADKGLSRR